MRRHRSSLLLGGQNCLNSLIAALDIFHPDDLKYRLTCTRTSWRIGCISAYSSTSPGSNKLAWQGFEALLSPKKQRRPLPSLLCKSFFYSFDPKKADAVFNFVTQPLTYSWCQKIVFIFAWAAKQWISWKTNPCSALNTNKKQEDKNCNLCLEKMFKIIFFKNKYLNF